MTPASLLVVASLASDRVAFTEVHMGVEARIVMCTERADQAAEAARRAFDVIRAWDLALSDWNPDSDAMRLPRGAGDHAHVEGRLATAMRASAIWRRRTDGAFDPAIGPLVQLWRRADEADAWPATPLIEEARERSGLQAMDWREDLGELTIRRDGARLDFGGIGQGLAADEALATLQACGFASAMVDISGDMALGNPPPGEPGWRIQIESAFDGQPVETLLLSGCGVSCSGDRGQPRRIGDREVSHIIDPGTGMPVPMPRQAVVIAADATRADALATALCVLPAERCGSLVADDAVAAARITRGRGEGATTTLGGWARLRRAPDGPADAPREPVAARPSPAAPAAGSPDPTAPAPR